MKRGKDSLFSKRCWALDGHMQKSKLGLMYTTELTQVRFTDLVRIENYEMKTEGKLLDFGLGNDFFGMTPKAENKSKNCQYYIKVKASTQQGSNQPWEEEIILQNTYI